MKVSKIALATALALGGASSVAFGQDYGQQPQQQEIPQTQQRQGAQQAPQDGAQLQLSEKEIEAVRPLEAAVRAKDWGAARAALPAAQAAAQSSDAKYFVARMTFVVGSQTQDAQLETQGIDALVDHPRTAANEREAFLNRQAELAFNAQDFAKAERAYSRLLEMTPNDSRILNNLAVVRGRMGNTSGALEAVEQTIQAAEAAGQRAEESAYERLLAGAMQSNRPDLVSQAAVRLLTAYPTAENWRRALVLLRRGGNIDEQANLDIYRLQRAAGALEGEQEYVLFADNLNRGGMPGEAKAVLDEGLARSQLSAGSQPVQQLSSTVQGRLAEDRASLPGQLRKAQDASNGRPARTMGDVLYGYGRYGEAAEMYRLALQKGGEDPNLLNTRLGAALAMAGQRAEAEAALRVVTGPRQALANYWLIWLNRNNG